MKFSRKREHSMTTCGIGFTIHRIQIPWTSYIDANLRTPMEELEQYIYCHPFPMIDDDGVRRPPEFHVLFFSFVMIFSLCNSVKHNIYACVYYQWNTYRPINYTIKTGLFTLITCFVLCGDSIQFVSNERIAYTFALLIQAEASVRQTMVVDSVHCTLDSGHSPQDDAMIAFFSPSFFF